MNSIPIHSEPEIDLSITSTLSKNEVSQSDIDEFQKAMLFKKAVKASFAHKPVPMAAPFREAALISANNSGRISEELAELIESAPTEAVALAAAASNLRPQSAPVFARMAFNSNPGESSDIAEAVVARAVPESPDKTSEIVLGVARELIQANPKEVVQIAMSVFGASVSANPELAKEIAPALAGLVSKLAPQSALDVGKELVGAGVSMNPSQASEIAQGVARELIQSNPNQAAEIAAAIAFVANQPAPVSARAIFDAMSSLLPTNQTPNTPEFAAQIIDAVAKANPDMAVQITSEVVTQALPFLGEEASKFPIQVLEKLRESSPAIAEAVAGVLINLSANSPIGDLAPGAPAKPEGLVVSPETSSKDKSTDGLVPQAPMAQPAVQNTAPNIPMPQAESRPTSGTDVANLLKLIAETVSKLEIGETSTTIELKNAPGLEGDVKLSMKLENGSLEVTIEASDENTRALLEINSTALKEALAKTASAGAVEISFTAPAENAPAESGADSEISRDGDSQSSDSKSGKDSQTRVSGKGGGSGAQQ
jgi:hypothetical protein